jgi:hypothetical protein
MHQLSRRLTGVVFVDYFQYSIGDAWIVLAWTPTWQDRYFQYSIGDAEKPIRRPVVVCAGTLSILHWRCP